MEQLQKGTVIQQVLIYIDSYRLPYKVQKMLQMYDDYP